MLVLSRKDGETIEIPDLGIVIQVTSIKKSRVTIGIKAPKDLAILRGEMANDTPAIKNEVGIDQPTGCSAIAAPPVPTVSQTAVKEPASGYCVPATSDSAFFHVA